MHLSVRGEGDETLQNSQTFSALVDNEGDGSYHCPLWLLLLDTPKLRINLDILTKNIIKFLFFVIFISLSSS